MAPQDTIHAALARWPASVQSLLSDVATNGGIVHSAVASQVIQQMGFIDIGPLMMALLPLAAAFARVPVSGFHVGAVAAGMPTGAPVPNLYLGANVEFTGQALSFSVHAEQAATNNAWLHGEQGLQALAVSAAPCGYCRQFLYELVAAQTLNILLPQKGTTAPQINPLTYFLPDAFGPHDLNLTGGLMTPQTNAVNLASSDPVVQAAIEGAVNCYAPYTSNFSSVALVAPGGAIYTGRYAENAAYNPSLSPLESALALMNMAGALQTSHSVTRAVLVETPTLASQRDATAAVLASAAPGIALEYFAA